MNILIDILHPADVHVLRNFREEMLGRGHDVHVAARHKDVAVPLLERYGIPFVALSRQRSGLVGLGIEWLVRSVRLARMARRTKADVLVGVTGPVIAPVGKLVRRPSVVFADAENATRMNRFVYPMATAFVTGDSYTDPVRGRHVTYAGYHQSAYLHSDRFTPDRGVVEQCGIDPDGWYAIVRFVSWESSHDVGEYGLDDERKRELVGRLSQRGRVFISSEGPLPEDLAPLELTTPTDAIHHLIAYSQIVVGESATMASEAAMLGVPAVYIRDTGRGYTDEQESRYGLVRNVAPADFAGIVAAVDELLETPDDEITERHRRLVTDKIDLTAWMVDFVENRRWVGVVKRR